MAKNGGVKKQNGKVSDETLRKAIEYQRIGNAAVHKAQEENRRLGIPNWYSINGTIVNESELNGEIKTQTELELETNGAISENAPEESAEEREIKRQKSIAWIKSHSEEYAGKYVALDGDKLIGTGERYGDALKIALQAGFKKAFIDYVYPKDYVGYWEGWN